MLDAIIYPQDHGRVALVYPTAEALRDIGFDAIAAKDVPEGRPWRIMEVATLPEPASRRFWRWTNQGPLQVVQTSTD